MKEVVLWTHYWGENFKNIVKDYTIPSCMSKGNVPALIEAGYKVVWKIFCDNPPVEASSIFEVINCNENQVNGSFNQMIRHSISTGAIILIIAPDYIVGDKTLYNAVKLIDGKPETCLCVPHARVSRQKMNGVNFDYSNFSNRDCVRESFKYAHNCLRYSFDNVDKNMTWEGISIREIGEGMYAVIHNLASPFACQFKKHDIDFFNNHLFSTIDRSFIKRIKDDGRVKICGASDLCFFAEITDDAHNPPLKNGLLNNDKHSDQNHFNESVCLWRT